MEEKCGREFRKLRKGRIGKEWGKNEKERSGVEWTKKKRIFFSSNNSCVYVLVVKYLAAGLCRSSVLPYYLVYLPVIDLYKY